MSLPTELQANLMQRKGELPRLKRARKRRRRRTKRRKTMTMSKLGLAQFFLSRKHLTAHTPLTPFKKVEM
jgi:hypothetical protein